MPTVVCDKMNLEELTRLEYIWLDNAGQLRSKVKLTSDEIENNSMGSTGAPQWSFDGSSTGQAVGNNSDCLLEPIAHYDNPIDGGYFVLCEVFDSQSEPHSSNARAKLADHDTINHDDWWFGFEQEYFFVSEGTLAGWPSGGYPEPQGDYYCGVGSQVGREIAEEHMVNCIHAGINVLGTNAEVALGQWEYQVFAKGHKKACDDLWMSRYILLRTAESKGVGINFHPKPVKGDWNGSGCHMNFSNPALREDGGMELIENICKKLEVTHEIAMENYGEDNTERLTGLHETQHHSKFSWGEMDRGASIRIPSFTVNNAYKGYLEDRRPASNIDPYKAVFYLLNTLVGQ